MYVCMYVYIYIYTHTIVHVCMYVPNLHTPTHPTVPSYMCARTRNKHIVHNIHKQHTYNIYIIHKQTTAHV